MNNKVVALGIASILTYSIPTLPVKAVSSKNMQTLSTENQERTAGLISNYNLYASTDNGAIILGGITRASVSMKSIGYTDICIEYSTDNVNWKEEKSIGDLLKSGNSYYLNDYAVSVRGGFYYRVSLSHYAKESGLFGSSQSVPNTSNSVWID